MEKAARWAKKKGVTPLGTKQEPDFAGGGGAAGGGGGAAHAGSGIDASRAIKADPG